MSGETWAKQNFACCAIAKACVNENAHQSIDLFAEYFKPEDASTGRPWWGVPFQSDCTDTPETPKMQLQRQLALLLMAEIAKDLP